MSDHRGGYNQQHQLIENYSAATIRALTGERDLYFRSHRLHKDHKRLPFHASHLQLTAETHLNDLRGVSDALALRLLHSDRELHQSLLPETPFEQLVFELLEQLRAESLVSDAYPGIKANLLYRFMSWSHGFHDEGLTDGALGLLLFTVAQISRLRLNRYAIPEEFDDLMESTRAGLSPLIGNDLRGLQETREDQAAFATHALNIATILWELIEENRKNSPNQGDKKELIKKQDRLILLLNQGNEGDENFTSVHSGVSRFFVDGGEHYRVFTREYDKIKAVADLVIPMQQKMLREQQDELLRHCGVNYFRLLKLLQSVFATPQRSGWDFGQEDGYLDGSRLTQLVTSPSERALFKHEAYPPRSHAAVTFLLDCSGSMKVHSDKLSVMMELFVKALERIGVQTEVLGFSTNSWNGGKPLKQWRAQGKPEHPGRLCENLQLIFKDADSGWRKARHTIPALLKQDLYREGVDGEAVDWACQRLLKQDMERRLLVVVSDGCPMDAATNQANDEFYLDNHLQQVVGRYEQQGQIEIYGLGVGMDLSPYYRRHLPVDLEQGVDNRMMADIVGLWRR